MEPQSLKLFARDIASNSDVELDKCLDANGRIIRVQDPENWPEDFFQRLRVRAGANHAVSLWIDLNYISVRLEEMHISREPSPRSCFPNSTPVVNEEQELKEQTKYNNTCIKERGRPSHPVSPGRDILEDHGENGEILSSRQLMNHDAEGRVWKVFCSDQELKQQTKYYNTLIREGGRPSHPVSLGRDILGDPGEYAEILPYWQLMNHDVEGRVWKVFRSQLCEWRRFREHQQKSRLFQSESRLDVYSKHLHSRLTKHGFTKSVQLHQDPDQQDKLTTWIEFLNYEYKIYDSFTDTIKRLQPQFDKAWKKLVDSNVLRPFETAEWFWNLVSVIQQQNEIHAATKAVGNATLAVMAAEKAFQRAQCAGLFGKSLSQIEKKLCVTRSQLAAAKTSLKQNKRRSDLVAQFKDQTKQHRVAEKDAKWQNILLRWILQQVPLIESELKSANGSITRNGGIRGLKRHRANALDEERAPKRQKLDTEMLLDENIPPPGPDKGLGLERAYSSRRAGTTRPKGRVLGRQIRICRLER